MVDGTPPYLPNDDAGEGAVFDAFAGYITSPEGGDDEVADSPGGDAPAAADEKEDHRLPSFTSTNPSGTVSVSTYLDGRVHQIELSAEVAKMTEPQLAEEVLVIAGLARQKARSAQYALMLDGMRDLGHDDVVTRDFLSRDMGLPSPEDATAETARLFATRYAAGDHD